jgi:hypothetical protein
MTIADVKQEALNQLAFSDWSELGTVTNTANTPHLANAAEYATYRIALRYIFVYPTENPTWPTIPVAQWVNA